MSVEKLKSTTNNNIAYFFWIYCLYGLYIYASNFLKFFEFAEAVPKLEIQYTGAVFLFKYNTLSNLFLMVTLAILLYPLLKKKKLFLTSYLWHTFILVIVNFYNEYLIKKIALFPSDLISFFDNAIDASVVLIWLVIWGLLIKKYEVGKIYFVK